MQPQPATADQVRQAIEGSERYQARLAHTAKIARYIRRVHLVMLPLTFFAATGMAWWAVGWKMAAALFLLAWSINISRKLGRDI